MSLAPSPSSPSPLTAGLREPRASSGRRLSGRLPALEPRVGWALVIAVSLAAAAGSLLYQNAPDFDPWGWIIWGREVLHLDLNSVQGPSWKPGPVLFTTVFAVFGGAAPTLWMLTARLGLLLAVVMAYRVASRLGGRLAGVIAAVLLLTLNNFLHGALYAESEPLMVGFLLFAVDLALSRRHRAALLLFWLAALMRPEIWPLMLAYSGYLWLRAPRERGWVLAAWALTVLLWFGGDWWGSGNPFTSSERAKQFVRWSPWDQYREPARAMLTFFANRLHRPAIVLALVAVVVAAVRRTREVLLVALGSLVTLACVAAMAQAGYPVLDRFLFASLALAFVLAGVGAAQLVAFASRRHTIAGVAVAVLVAAALSPLAVNNARRWGPILKDARHWSREVNTLPQAVAAAGGASQVAACRESITTYLLMMPTLAWDLHVHMWRIFDTKHYHEILFIWRTDPMWLVETRKLLRTVPLAQAAGWQVLYADTARPLRKVICPAPAHSAPGRT